MDEIRNDREIQVIQQESGSLVEKIHSITIDNPSSQQLATTWLGFIAKSIKRLEERRIFFTKPILESKKNIDNEFKTLIAPLEDLSRVLKDKLLGYSTYLKQQHIVRVEEMSAMAKDLGLPMPEQVESSVVATRTPLGSSYVVKRWAWKVVDETKIPREYFMLDEKKINAMMRAHQKTVHGVSSMDLRIEGIEFYQEDDIAVRT